jgi:hypothetical protein
MRWRRRFHKGECGGEGIVLDSLLFILSLSKDEGVVAHIVTPEHIVTPAEAGV